MPLTLVRGLTALSDGYGTPRGESSRLYQRYHEVRRQPGCEATSSCIGQERTWRP